MHFNVKTRTCKRSFPGISNKEIKNQSPGRLSFDLLIFAGRPHLHDSKNDNADNDNPANNDQGDRPRGEAGAGAIQLIIGKRRRIRPRARTRQVGAIMVTGHALVALWIVPAPTATCYGRAGEARRNAHAVRLVNIFPQVIPVSQRPLTTEEKESAIGPSAC